MLIDAHAHVFESLSGFGADGELRRLKDGKARWATGDIVQLIPEKYADSLFTADDLIQEMDANKIDRAVLLQGGLLGFDNYGKAEAVKRYPDRLTAALAVDPFCRNLDRILSCQLSLGFRSAKFEASVGCGLMGAHSTFDLAGDMMMSLYEKMAGSIKTFAFDLGSPGDESHQAESIRKIALSLPEINIVVCHLLSARKHQEETLKRELDLLRLDNVYFDTAALFWKTRPEAYPFPIARQYITDAIGIVGAEHLMWGSDAPTTLVHVDMKSQIQYSADLFSEEEKEWYFHKTAEKVYFLDAE